MVRSLLTVFLLTLSCAWLSAVASPTTLTLDNGMEVILVENHASPMIASTVIVRAGSRHESIELSGATHFLEHLLFNGTETRTQKQLYDEMDFLGGYNNANTTHDHTNFMILLEKSNFEKGLEIQADMLIHSILPPDKFEKEKGIVIEEIGKDEDDESYRIGQFFNRFLYNDTPYQWPVLGSRQSIRNLTRDKVWEYYKIYYVPNNMIALIMGDFNTAEMTAMVQRIFGQIAPKALPEEKPLRLHSRARPTRNDSRTPLITTGKASSHKICFSTAAPTRLCPDYFPFMVMVDMLEGRLQQEMTAPAELGVPQVSLEHFVDRDFARLNVTLTLNPSVDFRPALAELGNSIERFRQEMPTEQKVSAAVTSIRTQEIFNAERPHYYGMLKSDDLAQGGINFFLNYLQNLSKVSAKDVHKVAMDYLDARRAEVAVYEADTTAKSTAEAPAVEKLLEKTLDNGLRVVIQENHDNPIFAAHFLFKNRSAYELSLGGKPGMVDFLHHVMDYGPTGMDKESFQAELKPYGAQVKFYDMAFIPYDDYYTTPEYSYVRLEALDESYLPVLELVAQDLMKLNLTPEVVEQVRGPMVGLAKRDQGSVSKSGEALFDSLLYGNSALGADVVGSSEDVSAYTLEELQSFAGKYLGPQNLILTIVTGNDAEVVFDQVQRIFASWSNGSPLPPVSISRPQGPPQRREESGGKEQSYLAMGYSFDLADPLDRAPLAILNAIISDRMQFQLREREGLAYTLGSSVSFHSGWGVWEAKMGTGPQNLKRAEAGILDEVRKAAKENFSPRDVEKAGNAYLGRLAMRSLTRISRAYLMGLGELHQEGAERHERWMDELRQVTAADVDRVARQYLRTDQMTVAITR